MSKCEMRPWWWFSCVCKYSLVLNITFGVTIVITVKIPFDFFFLSRKTKSYKFSKARQIYPFRSKTRQCESFCSHRAWKFIFVSRIVESGRDFFTFFKWTPQFKKQSFLTTRQFCLLIFKNGNYYYFTQCKIYFKKFMISLVKIGFTNQYFFIIQILISESRTLAAKWRSIFHKFLV